MEMKKKTSFVEAHHANFFQKKIDLFQKKNLVVVVVVVVVVLALLFFSVVWEGKKLLTKYQ